jgi:hypothetical protein
MRRRFFATLGLVVGLCLASTSLQPSAQGVDLPSRLSDQDFWQLSADASEPNGFFRSDNLTSNELLYQRVIPELLARTRQGGVYLGVGPEQNFTYMATVRPAMAIIFDIRRGNTLVQLMYKALFELAKDRADFVSMLFSKPRPAGLGPDSTAVDIFSAFATSPGSEALYSQNLKAVQSHLVKTRGAALSAGDLFGIDRAYRAFFRNGFAVRPRPTYSALMTQTDEEGVSRSYLATESNFRFLKDLESRNLVIPVVGDFAGPKAIRTIAAYLKAHSATVTAFYLSNVEQYLYQDNKWTAFCRNAALLPIDAKSTFIRSESRGVGGFVSSLGGMAGELEDCDKP